MGERLMAKKRVQKKTYNEFLAWLEGVESMQSDAWVPDEHQWKTIRDMLNNVKPDRVEVNKPVKVATQVEQKQTFLRTANNRAPAPLHQTVPIQPGGPTLAPPASSFDAPPPQPPPAQPARQVPSGMPQGGQADLLTPGEAHQTDEYV